MHWALGPGTFAGLHTLTRYSDPAKNSDKYRRFIVLYDPNDHERKILLTQTGRWTHLTSIGNWQGGTYRITDDGAKVVDRRSTAQSYLAKHVQRKLGDYSASWSDRAMDEIDLRFALARLHEELAKAGNTVPTTPSAGVDNTGNLQSAVDSSRPAAPAPEVRPGADTAVGDQVAWLLRTSVQPGHDEFEMLGAYAEINQKLAQEQAHLTSVADDLKLALAHILKPGAA